MTSYEMWWPGRHFSRLACSWISRAFTRSLASVHEASHTAQHHSPSKRPYELHSALQAAQELTDTTNQATLGTLWNHKASSRSTARESTTWCHYYQRCSSRSSDFRGSSLPAQLGANRTNNNETRQSQWQGPRCLHCLLDNYNFERKAQFHLPRQGGVARGELGLKAPVVATSCLLRTIVVPTVSRGSSTYTKNVEWMVMRSRGITNMPSVLVGSLSNLKTVSIPDTTFLCKPERCQATCRVLGMCLSNLANLLCTDQWRGYILGAPRRLFVISAARREQSSPWKQQPW